MEVKGIILDIDGVIVGEKIGFNSPSPHPDVISALKQIKSKGIFIFLCTAKPCFAIREIIASADLCGPHITDGGAVLINPVSNSVLESNFINNGLAIKLLSKLIENKVYTEFYTTNDYFIQKDQVCGITDKHSHVLQQSPKMVESIIEAAKREEITKIMPVAKNLEDKERIIEFFGEFENDLVLSWGVHPVALPLQFGIVTAKGISKKNAAEKIVQDAGLSFDDVLGVGDSMSDWQFIQLCRYGGVMGNAPPELKNLIVSKGEGFFCIGPSVDENGAIDVFKEFGLL